MWPSIPDKLFLGLQETGYYSCDVLVPKTLCENLLLELLSLEESDALNLAGTGRGQDYTINSDIRRDKIRWLDGSTVPQVKFLTLMNELRMQINRRLFLGLCTYEAHFACYGPGDFYKLHRDSFTGEANRVLSTVLYLNPDWQSGDGGELRIYDTNAVEIIKEIEPRLATMAIFLSEEIWHEVSPARQPRRSIAGWFRINTGPLV
ncbi:MAG: 2OG-Fe(II) oxygenase [Candidatus Cloacimonetes bacterium]|nr:2OG-Fe(II) oxygenase [Candidatus Cloacimonadota bacterium]